MGKLDKNPYFCTPNNTYGKENPIYITRDITIFTKIRNCSDIKKASQVIQEAGKEIRVFMPRFGVINERRHQLHEVIRLSGLNICIDDHDHPLIIKVASVSAARMQVYFIDNDEYFRRKFTLTDDKDKEFKDNDERSMFSVVSLGNSQEIRLATGCYSLSWLHDGNYGAIHKRNVRKRSTF